MENFLSREIRKVVHNSLQFKKLYTTQLLLCDLYPLCTGLQLYPHAWLAEGDAPGRRGWFGSLLKEPIYANRGFLAPLPPLSQVFKISLTPTPTMPTHFRHKLIHPKTHSHIQLLRS